MIASAGVAAKPAEWLPRLAGKKALVTGAAQGIGPGADARSCRLEFGIADSGALARTGFHRDFGSEGRKFLDGLRNGRAASVGRLLQDRDLHEAISGSGAR